MRLRVACVTLALCAGSTGCALFFEDQADGAGGAGSGGGSTTSSGGGSTSSSGGGGSSLECVGLQQEIVDGQVESWLWSAAGTTITGLGRGAGNGRSGIVGKSVSGARCGLEGLGGASGEGRLFYGEFKAADGAEPLVVDLGPADDGEVVVSSGASTQGTHVVWRRGRTICAERLTEMGALVVTDAEPCGAAPLVHCTASTDVAGLFAGSSLPPLIGFRAADGGSLSCEVPVGATRAYGPGYVLVSAAQTASSFAVTSADVPFELVRAASVATITNEARLVGWCPSGAAITGSGCGGGSYFQAFISPDDGNVGFGLRDVQLIGPVESTLNPLAGIHPHAWGYAFTSVERNQHVLEWGTETDSSGGLPITSDTYANAENPSAPGRTEILGAAEVSPTGIALLAGRLSTGIDSVASCQPDWGSCGFVMRVNGTATAGGLEVHVEPLAAGTGDARAEFVFQDGGAVVFAGGYTGGPLVHGPLRGLDGEQIDVAYVARGRIQ